MKVCAEHKAAMPLTGGPLADTPPYVAVLASDFQGVLRAELDKPKTRPDVTLLLEDGPLHRELRRLREV